MIQNRIGHRIGAYIVDLFDSKLKNRDRAYLRQYVYVETEYSGRWVLTNTPSIFLNEVFNTEWRDATGDLILPQYPRPSKFRFFITKYDKDIKVAMDHIKLAYKMYHLRDSKDEKNISNVQTYMSLVIGSKYE